MKVESFEVVVKTEKSAKRFFATWCRKNGHFFCTPGVVAEKPIGSGEDGIVVATAGMSLETSLADGLESSISPVRTGCGS